MLAPKRVKYRKQQKGHRRGMAIRGSTLSFGDFGLKALGNGFDTKDRVQVIRQRLILSVS